MKKKNSLTWQTKRKKKTQYITKETPKRRKTIEQAGKKLNKKNLSQKGPNRFGEVP